MPRQQQGRYSSESSRRRESQRNRYTSEDAPRNPRESDRDEGRWRGDEYPERYRSRGMEDRELHQDERGRYRSSGRREDAGYGGEWPESYRSDFSGEAPQRYRDSWSERQSGPYRSAESGEPLSEDDYRQESRYYRSSPYTGFSGRVSEFGYEDECRGVKDVDNRIRVRRRESEERYTVSEDGGSIKPAGAAGPSGANRSDT